MRTIKESELIIKDDGAVYHLGLSPDEMAENVVVVGDPGRVSLVASFFDEVLVEKSMREFHSVLGKYKGKKVLAISSGISSDNIDILVNELDALVNIDFATRQIKGRLTTLNIVRIGTCGAVSDEVELGDFVLSRYAVGGDGMLNAYKDSVSVRFPYAEDLFIKHMDWPEIMGRPYIVQRSFMHTFDGIAKSGITYCAGGFYAAQGRELRLQPLIPDLPAKLEGFEYNGVKMLNVEMEGAGLVGLARMLGHRAVTLCVVVAHRKKQNANVDYNDRIKELIQQVLEKI